MKTLVLTVGGSDDPVIHAIRQNAPEFVVFLASQVDGAQSAKISSHLSVPQIASAAGLSDSSFVVEVTRKPDDLADVWDACRRIQQRVGDDQVTANYTGGTKTMTAALVAFAIQHGWELQVQVGHRVDLVRVTSNDRSRIQMGVHASRIDLALTEARYLRDRNDYAGARMLLERHPSAQLVDDDRQARIDSEIRECDVLDACV